MSIPRYIIYRAVDCALDPRLILKRRRGAILGLLRALDQPWMRGIGIRTVIDVGANVGRFSVTARALLPTARIVAVDPLPDCLARARAAMGDDPLFTTSQTALGDSAGSATFHRSDASSSSSFLPMTEAHAAAFPGTARSRPLHVAIQTLDALAAELELDPPFFLKLDVQGFEGRVIAGAAEVLGETSVVLVETSFESMYEGQPLFADIHDLLAEAGFEFRGNIDEAYHRGDGRALQADSLFIRRGAL